MTKHKLVIALCDKSGVPLQNPDGTAQMMVVSPSSIENTLNLNSFLPGLGEVVVGGISYYHRGICTVTIPEPKIEDLITEQGFMVTVSKGQMGVAQINLTQAELLGLLEIMKHRTLTDLQATATYPNKA